MQQAFRKIISIVLVAHSISAYASQAVAPLRNRTPLLEQLLKTAVVTNASTVKTPPVISSQLRQAAPPLLTALQPIQQSSFTSYHSGQHSNKEQGSWKQEKGRFINRNAIKKALGITTAAAIIAVIAEATDIADRALKAFNVAMFDENLLSDEFSRAIVRIYSHQDWVFFSKQLKGSAFIVKSEKNPEWYFVLTAAHCIGDHETYVEIKDPHHLDEFVRVELAPILIDPNNDVAILLIPFSEVKKFQDTTNKELPAIPAHQLSTVKPHKHEVLMLQGYPLHVPFKDFYREKLTSKGAAKINLETQIRDVTELVPVDQHEPEMLSGVSGGPIIAIRNKQPQIQRITSGGRVKKVHQNDQLVRSGPVLATGVGELPTYLQKAEERVLLLQEAEKKAQTKKSWWQWW